MTFRTDFGVWDQIFRARHVAQGGALFRFLGHLDKPLFLLYLIVCAISPAPPHRAGCGASRPAAPAAPNLTFQQGLSSRNISHPPQCILIQQSH
ncbi:hypothetical protein BP1258A_1434 [Burkholderia pseudomallei 1258a]|nr:hypothetical protein BP1258A_1434 [Burkholderia pseudomallei 1258a]EIF67723.1 hypothetical protein BP1258B_1527 [Burkholderia pseudomallei 1258b]